MPARVVDPQYVALKVGTPPGSTSTSPQVVPITLPSGILEAVDLTIPPGHLGFTGVSLRLSGTTILPFSNPERFIIGDNLQETFLLGVEIDTKLQVASFNTGQYSHAFYFRFRVRVVPVASGIPQVTPAAMAAVASS